MRFLFVRHGETALNKEKRFRGFQDVPLDENGLQEANLLYKRYRHGLNAVYSSDMQRATQTADVLGQDGIPVTQLPDLRPWNVGVYSGRPKNPENKAAIERYARLDVAPPAGERISVFGDRFQRALERIKQDTNGGEGGGTVAVVSHASNIHELSKLLSNGDINALNVEPGGAVEVVTGNGGQPKARVLHGKSQDPDGAIS